MTTSPDSPAADAAPPRGATAAPPLLRAELAVLDALFATVPVGLAFLDADLRYRRVNPALAAMNGQPVEAHLGRRPSELLGPPGETLEALLRAVLEGRAVRDLEMATLIPGGDEVVHLQVSLFPVEVEGRVAGVGGVVVDLTRERQDRQALHRVNQELHRAMEQRALLMQTLAHELKNPLLTLGLEMHLLELAQADQERARSMAALQRNIDRLQSLARDLGDVARLQGGQLPLETRRVPLRWMVEEAIARHAHFAEHAGLDLRLDLPGADGAPVEAEVVVDPRRIAQVLDNLLGNALKFTPSGGEVVVSIAADGGAAMVRVRDTGPGLDPDQLGRLFQPFSRLHPQAGKHGTGLGLYVTKGIVEQHGGAVWAESDGPGRGSTFVVRLPGADPDPS